MRKRSKGVFWPTAALCALLPAAPTHAVDFFWSATAETFGWFDRETPNGPPGFSPWMLAGGGFSGQAPDDAADSALLSTSGKTTTLGTSVTVNQLTISGDNAILQMNGGSLTTVNGFAIQSTTGELAFTGGTVNNSTGGLTNNGIIRGLSGAGTISGNVMNAGQVLVGNNATLNFTGNNTDYTQTAGSFDITAGGTANFNGFDRSFNLNGGTFNNAGDFNLNNGGTFSLNGGSIVNTADLRINAGGTFNHISGAITGEVRMAGGDLNLMTPLTTLPAALGSPVFRMTANGSLSGDIHQATSVIVEGTGSSLTVGVDSTPIENRGSLVLSSDSFNGFGAVTFQSGGGLDNNGGTVHAAFNAGGGNSRRLTSNGAATLTNRNGGQLVVDPDIQLTLTMDVVNTADIDVGLGGAILAGNNVLFEMNGGALNNAGAVVFSSGSGPSVFRYTAGTISGNPIAFNNGQLELAGGTSPATFHFTGSALNRHSGDIRAGQTLVVDADIARASVSNGTVFVGDNSFSNAGTIRLTGADSNDSATYFLAGNMSVFTNTGLLHAQGIALSSNNRIFTGSSGAAMINTGQITIDPDTTLSLNMPVVNIGDVTIGIGGTLDMDASGFSADFTHNAGTITNNGSFILGGSDDFTFNGGSITGNPIEISEAVLTLGPNTGPASFVLRRGQLVGDIRAGQTVELRNDLASNQITDTPGPITNHGTLIHGGSGAGGGANVFRIGGLFQNLVITNNGSYSARNDNASQLGGARRLNGELHNFGSATVEPHATYTAQATVNRSTFTILPDGAVELTGGQSFTQQAGTLVNNGSFDLGNGSFFYNGGDVTGNTITADGTLVFGPGLTGGGDFVMNNNGGFGGEVPAAVSVRFVGPAINFWVVNAGVAPGDTINHGRIVLDNSLGGFVDLRTLGTHTIESSGKLQGDGRVSFQAAPGTLINRGLIEPGGIAGDETGLIRVSGKFMQEATGTLRLQLGGNADNDYDRVTVTNSADLGGTLDLATTSGFTPQLGDSFILLTASSLGGTTFDQIAGLNLGGGNGFAVSYTSNQVVLTSIRLGDTDGDGDVDDTDLGIMISNFTGPVGNAGNKTLVTGDTDSDGDVDDTDLGLAISGFTGPLPPSAVPEPAVAVILIAGLIGSTRRRC